MRAALAALAVAAAAAAALLWASAAPRHVDPLAVRPVESPLAAVEALSYAAGLIAGGETSAAGQILSNVTEAPLPPAVRPLYLRMAQLLNETAGRINATRTYLARAEEALRRSDPGAARRHIASASAELARAEAVLAGLKDLASQIPISQAAQRLNDAVAALEKAAADLRSRASQLLAQANRTAAAPVNITASAAPLSLVPGQAVEVWGLLTADGRPLAGRVVQVHIGSAVVPAVTDAGGGFRVVHNVTEYRRALPVYAEYVPRWTDRLIYSSARSPTVNLTLSFTTPAISVRLNASQVPPGGAVALEVSLSHPLAVAVRTPFGNLTSPPAYRHRVELGIPPNASEGLYRLSVAALPSGPVGPANATALLEVRRIPVRLQVEAPRQLLTGLTYTLKVDTDVPARIYAAADPDVQVSVEGDAVRLHVPPTRLAPIALTVSAEPLDPTRAPSAVSLRLEVYNVPTMAATAAAAMAAVAVPALRRRPRPTPSTAPPAPRPPTPPPTPDGPLVAAQRALEALTGVPLGRSQTYREYLAAVLHRLPRRLAAVARAFYTQLEAYVYGGPKYSRLADRLRALAQAIIGLARGRE